MASLLASSAVHLVPDAFTMATIPTFTGSGRLGHADTTAANSASADAPDSSAKERAKCASGEGAFLP